ncbi:MAG: serine/threonine-protein kinase, partial [Gammaproteobacteria bacterium]
MKAERFRQIRNLFDAALERDAETRNAFLQEACRGDEELLVEVGRLLAAQGEPTAWIDESMLGPPLPRLEGRNIGAYEVLRQVGEGGMGAVYLAARTDRTSRELVALKIVRPEAANEEVLRRFKREREILESLDHPNIARVFDGGVTGDGLPYLVMEYVDGQQIDAYCDEHRLDPGARLKLFRDVCAAVHYAHEHRVVHRDLKPSNILVTAHGVVKLLDFGISKLVASGSDTSTLLTRTDLLLMTPEYASPEQVSGLAATPASDVYALGVVLYELLTGRRPYRLRSRIFREIVRVICDELPVRPSAAVTRKDADEGAPTPDTLSRARALSSTELRRQLAGDLDCILLKALEKDPIERYRSAQQFSEDLGLHLSGRMVEA